MRLSRPAYTAIAGGYAIFGIVGFLSSHVPLFAQESKRYKRECFQPMYGAAGAQDIVNSLEKWRNIPALRQLDDYHSELAQMNEAPSFHMSKDANGKEIISISFGDIRAPWKEEDYPKYFERFCAQTNPDKKFCTKALEDKYRQYTKYLNSLGPTLQPFVDRMLKDPTYNPHDDIVNLKLDPRDNVISTIARFGWDDRLFLDPRNILQGDFEGFLKLGRVKDRQGKTQPNFVVVIVGNQNTGKSMNFVTFTSSPLFSDMENPIFFTGIDEREWNCYMQSKFRETLYLDGKPIC